MGALASRGRQGAGIVPAPCLSAPLRRRAAGRFVALGDHAAARDQRSRPVDFDDHAAKPDVDAHGAKEPVGQDGDADPFGVDAWLGALSERERLVVFLRYFADLDYRSIAAALDVKIGTVSATLHSAHEALRRSLEEAPQP